MATIAPSFFTFSIIFFILAGIEDIHKCLNKLEFRQDLTTDYGIISPRASEKSTYNLVATLASLFLIGSSSCFAGNFLSGPVWLLAVFVHVLFSDW